MGWFIQTNLLGRLWKNFIPPVILALTIHPAEYAAADKPWPVAVIYQIRAGKRVFVGTVRNVTFPAEAREADPKSVPIVSHEVWFAGDGKVKGIWFSAPSRTWGEYGRSNVVATAHPDKGQVRALVDSARPPTREVHFQADMLALNQYPSPPRSLKDLVKSSSVIAVGRVVGILRQAHSPTKSSNPDQHTVFAIAVDEYLKILGHREAPILKIHQTGGPLLWKDPLSGSTGRGYSALDEPRLQVGDLYILFANQPPDFAGAYRSQGYFGGSNGKWMELDEYRLTHNWIGQLRIIDGVTTAPPSRRGPAHWRFEEGKDQINGVPLAEAIAAIRRAFNP